MYYLDLQLKPHHKRQLLHSFYIILSTYFPCSRQKKLWFWPREIIKAKSSLPDIHLTMEYLTACGLVSHSTAGNFLYTYRNSSYPALRCDICWQLATFSMSSWLAYSSVLYVSSCPSAGYLGAAGDSLQHPLYLQHGAKVPLTWL